MNRPREIAQIEETLGRVFSTRALLPHMAFCSPIDQPIDEIRGPVWDIRTNVVEKVKRQVEEHCLLWSAMGYTVFVGCPDDHSPDTVFAIAHAVLAFNRDAYYEFVSWPRFDDEDGVANEVAAPEPEPDDAYCVARWQRLIVKTGKLEMWWD